MRLGHRIHIGWQQARKRPTLSQLLHVFKGRLEAVSGAARPGNRSMHRPVAELPRQVAFARLSQPTDLEGLAQDGKADSALSGHALARIGRCDQRYDSGRSLRDFQPRRHGPRAALRSLGPVHRSPLAPAGCSCAGQRRAALRRFTIFNGKLHPPIYLQQMQRRRLGRGLLPRRGPRRPHARRSAGQLGSKEANCEMSLHGAGLPTCCECVCGRYKSGFFGRAGRDMVCIL
jgi:hypothetical protein